MVFAYQFGYTLERRSVILTEPTSALQLKLSGLRVLIVDDMPAMRTILRDMLEQLGARAIIEAEDADTAWEMLQQNTRADDAEPFGLVISDWNMPGMTGMDLLRSLRSYTPTRAVPFLMITGEGDLDHLSEAWSMGVADYVVKPFDLAQLKEKLLNLELTN
jgi:two-component system, chemotaxis family, chemotaxis protein CheY